MTVTPTFKAAGTVQSGTSASLTTPWPASVAIGDLAILRIASNNLSVVAPVLSQASGFVLFGSSVSSDTDTRCDVYWCIATSTSPTSVIVAGTGVSGQSQAARILTYSNANNGAPLVLATAGSASSAGIAWPSGTTPVAQCLLSFIIGAGNFDAQVLNNDFANSNLSSITQVENDNTASALAGEFVANYVAGPGTFGGSTSSFSIGATNYGCLVIAIEPIVPPVVPPGPPPPLNRLRGPWIKPGMFVRPPQGITVIDSNPQPLTPVLHPPPPLNRLHGPWIKPGMFKRPAQGIVPQKTQASLAVTLDDVKVNAGVHVSSSSTLRAIQAGSTRFVYVAAIEGYPYLLTDGDPAAAVTAWTGTDWSQALTGLVVELDNQQTFDPWQPFLGGGTCALKVQPDKTDQFGTDLARTLTSPETEITSPLDRGTLGINVKSTVGFAAAPGFAFIGNECFKYASISATQFGFCARGYYSPFSAGATGQGGQRWAEMHRFGNVDYSTHVQSLVTKARRTWVGAWVGVWMHRVVGGVLDTKSEATLVYAGQIADTNDDSATGYAVVNLKHVLDVVRDTQLLRDQYSAVLADGIYLAPGLAFGWEDTTGGTNYNANSLVVVASGATGSAQINAGFYTVNDIVSALNSWLAQETAAGRLFGSYSWALIADPGAALALNPLGGAFRVHLVVSQTNAINISFTMNVAFSLPHIVAALMGIQGQDVIGGVAGIQNGDFTATFIFTGLGIIGMAGWNDAIISPTVITNTVSIDLGASGAPFRTLFGSSNLGILPNQPVQIASTKGTFFDQYDYLPADKKPADRAFLQWGVFLVAGNNLMVGAIGNGQLLRSNLYYTNGANTALQYDGSNTPNVEIVQIAALQASWSALVELLFKSSGTTFYNDASNDVLGYGLGINIPGALLGAAFDQSVAAMPGADLVQTVYITKPAVVADVINVDCILRGVHLIFKLGQLQLAPWSTPQLGSTSVTLTEHNKAEPNGKSNQRASTVLSTAWAHPIVKISFDWDPIADVYASILVLEDEIAIDDAGSVPDAFSLDAKNLTSAGIDTIAAPFFARWIPNLSRALRILTRSISPALYEGIGVGDSALVSDAFARDPSTGARGTNARAGLIVRHRYNPGGATAGGGKPRDAAGEVDVVFLATDRTAVYSPAAEVDETNSAGGFAAGYNSGTNTLAFHPHEHTLLPPGGGNFDVGFFKVNDLVEIVETDPANPASPQRFAPVTVLSVTSSQCTIDTFLAGWDITKRYRMRSVAYLSAQPTQQVHAYEADATIGEIQSTAAPFQYSNPLLSTSFDDGLQLAELAPNLEDADGAPRDAGYERALARTINNIVDGKSAHQSPVLDDQERQNTTAGWQLTHMTRLYLGPYQFSGGSTHRALAAAMRLRSIAGNFILGRVTITATRPTDPTYTNVTLTAPFASAIFQTNSTSYVVTGEHLLDMSFAALDLVGWCWLLVEVSVGGATTGLAQLIERARTS